MVSVLVLLGAGGYFAQVGYGRLCWVWVEEEVVETYAPVVRAIGAYNDDYGELPVVLRDLRPEYMSRLPVLKRVVEVDYSASDESGLWRITLTAVVFGEERTFIFASDAYLLPEEVARVYSDASGWRFLRGR